MSACRGRCESMMVRAKLLLSRTRVAKRFRAVAVSGWAYNDMESFLLRWVAAQAHEWTAKKLRRWRGIVCNAREPGAASNSPPEVADIIRNKFLTRMSFAAGR